MSLRVFGMFCVGGDVCGFRVSSAICVRTDNTGLVAEIVCPASFVMQRSPIISSMLFPRENGKEKSKKTIIEQRSGFFKNPVENIAHFMSG